MKKLLHLIVLVLLFCAVPQQGFTQFKIPEKPDFQTSVYDYAKLFSSDEKTQLEEKLVRYSDTTSTQIVIATVENLNGDSAGRVAPEWAQAWGVGQKDKDNGVFILVSRDDRDMYIATGYGVQGRLTAGQVGTIIRSVITPEFKKGDYYAGLDNGTDAIFQALNGKFKGERKGDDVGFFGLIPFVIILVVIILVIIILVVIFRNRGGGGGGNRGWGGPDLTDILILSSLGRGRGGSGWGGGSSGGWSGGGGGGFGGGFGGGGFGGGGFSGGGAGGSW